MNLSSQLSIRTLIPVLVLFSFLIGYRWTFSQTNSSKKSKNGKATAEEKASVEEGDRAPGFRANDHRGELWTLSEQAGERPVVLYFYPAAMTKGCTKQACSFRDRMDALNKLDAKVVGVSGDPVRNLQLFRNAHDLNFTLLSDPDASIAAKYSVPAGEGGEIERSVDGTSHTLRRGATFKRWTFVIDRSGRVVYRKANVDPVQDSKNVIEVLNSLK